MANRNDNVSQFYVVHFIEKPFKGIDDYVCVPYTWVIMHNFAESIVIVAYPKDEDPSVTRERAKKKERYQSLKDWCANYTAELKYQSNTYEDAECWILRKKNDRLLVQENSKAIQKKLPWDHELRCANQKYLSYSKDKSKSTATPYEIPRKQLPKAMDTESYDDDKKQCYLKRLNLVKTDTAKSTVQKIITKPESSTTEQSIAIEDKQSIECAATKDVKSTEDNTHSSKQNNCKPSKQEPIVLIIDADTEVNIEDQSQQEQHKNTRSQNQLAAPKPPSPVEQTPQNQDNNQRLRTRDIRALTEPSNNQELRVDDVSNNRPCTSQLSSSSLSMLAEMLKQNENSTRNMAIGSQNGSILVEPIKPLANPLIKSSTNVQTARQGTSILMTNNINRAPVAGMAISSQEFQHVAAMNPVPATDLRRVGCVTAPENIAATHQYFSFAPQIVQHNVPYPQEYKQTREQDLAQRFTAYRFAPQHLQNRPSEVTQHQPIRPSFSNNPNVPSQFHQPLDIQHGVQRVVNYQSSQQYPASIPVLPRNSRRSPTLQGVKNTTPPPSSPRAPVSVVQVLVNALKTNSWNDQELQVILNAIFKKQVTPDFMNALREVSVLQKHSQHSFKPTGSSYQSSRMEPPPVHGNVDQNPRLQTQVDQTNSKMKRGRFQDDEGRATKQMRADSGCPTNMNIEEHISLPYGAAADSGIDTDHEATIGYEMSVDEAHETSNEIDQTEDNSADRSQNYLLTLAKQQQMVEQLSTIHTKMNSTLRNAANMFDNLRDSVLETTKLYQTLCDNQRFDTPENSVSHAPSSSNVTPEVPPAVVESQTSAPERRNSGNGNQQSDDVIKTPEKIHQKNSTEHPYSTRWYALPPEYDPNNTKWTLKYQKNMPGLVELLPKSKIYVKVNELKRCEQVSKSCELLARLMLHEVFNEKALRVCASMTEVAKVHYKSNPDARPALDNHGSLILLNYVVQYGVKFGWSADVAKILNTLDHELKEMRFNYDMKSIFELLR